MNIKLDSFIKDYCTSLVNAIICLDHKQFEKIIDCVLVARQNNKTIYLLGNGGSSATPSHSAGDWAKEIGIKAICLSDNVPMLTAFANDNGYENTFRKMLEIYLAPGDLVLAYSGSGCSRNILQAVTYSRQRKNTTIGITGNYKDKNGGELVKIVDHSIIVQSNSMEQIEDIHLIINHIIKEYIKSI